MQPVLFPFAPQQRLPLQLPELHCEFELHEDPSDFFATTHAQFDRENPEEHLLQSPSESHDVQPVVWPLVPQHLEPLQLPEPHSEFELHEDPSERFESVQQFPQSIQSVPQSQYELPSSQSPSRLYGQVFEGVKLHVAGHFVLTLSPISSVLVQPPASFRTAQVAGS